tara:strand:- start:1215 stop:1928 length:714 start_codon:yes stop_codon:yes gene_type:complete
MTSQATLTDIALPGRAQDPNFHLSTYQAGSGPAVVFVHGFPDLALGWHKQLGAVADLGFHAIAPDMRGYGGSSCPHPIEAYMDQHVRSIVSKIMRTAPPLEEVFAVAFADGKLNMNPFLNIENAPDLGDPLMSGEDFEHYVAAFTRTGFRGGINWYRNIDNNGAAHPDVGVVPLDIPCLMLMADLDPALRPEFATDMPERCSDLKMHVIESAGHWVNREQADAFNSHLLPWLQQRFG